MMNMTNQTDPLGLGVMQRARDHRLQMDIDTPNTMGLSGPLADPNWDGLFQALHEQGAGRVTGGQSPAGSNQLTGASRLNMAVGGLGPAPAAPKAQGGYVGDPNYPGRQAMDQMLLKMFPGAR